MKGGGGLCGRQRGAPSKGDTCGGVPEDAQESTPSLGAAVGGGEGTGWGAAEPGWNLVLLS